MATDDKVCEHETAVMKRIWTTAAGNTACVFDWSLIEEPKEIGVLAVPEGSVDPGSHLRNYLAQSLPPISKGYVWYVPPKLVGNPWEKKLLTGFDLHLYLEQVAQEISSGHQEAR